MPTLTGDIADAEESTKICPLSSLTRDLPLNEDVLVRPQPIRSLSSPIYTTPLRHHQRQHPPCVRQVKESLQAHSEFTNDDDDGGAGVHRINQYIIGEMIGRGSYGAVHIAVDPDGTNYAVKEFSKSRLRKRAQSNILRRPHPASRRPGVFATNMNLNSPMHRTASSGLKDTDVEGAKSPLNLIKTEIAIMKKLDHDNLVSLVEVLDDPNEDSLYMVMEMCHKGVVMKVGLDQTADPYDDNSCRCWFRDLILGIEYLHAQGVVHRDIKPDNLLLTSDDVLKIVDFGVSEMFERGKPDIMVAKSAGSPAFLAPELCVVKHGEISGKAADIWSMGVTLYCLRFGRLPFEKGGVMELYEAIKHDPIVFPNDTDLPDSFRQLILRLLEKDPAKRITLPEIREHAWVIADGDDPLLSTEENTAHMVEPPTQEETDKAITKNIKNVAVFVKAMRRFKEKVSHRRAQELPVDTFDPVKTMASKTEQHTDAPEITQPDLQKRHSATVCERLTTKESPAEESKGDDKLIINGKEENNGQRILQKASQPYEALKSFTKPSIPQHDSETNQSRVLTPPGSQESSPQTMNNPLSGIKSHDNPHYIPHRSHTISDPHYLQLGLGGSSRPPSPAVVSESPPAAGMDIYEQAYQEQVKEIRAQRGGATTLFLTRRVEKMDDFLRDQGLIRGDESVANSRALGGLSKAIEAARSLNLSSLHKGDGMHRATSEEAARTSGHASWTSNGHASAKWHNHNHDTHSRPHEGHRSLHAGESAKEGLVKLRENGLHSFSKLVEQVKSKTNKATSDNDPEGHA